MARPPAWADKVKCPDEARDFYLFLQKNQFNLRSFDECHPFEGASIGHVPHLSLNNKLEALPNLVLAFFGLTRGKRTCMTHNCANFRHYMGEERPKTLSDLHNPPQEIPQQPTTIEAYKETVMYYIDKHDVNTFEELRPLIPVEDITDELLTIAIESLKK